MQAGLGSESCELEEKAAGCGRLAHGRVYRLKPRQ
jgi:hypothetical protein